MAPGTRPLEIPAGRGKPRGGGSTPQGASPSPASTPGASSSSARAFLKRLTYDGNLDRDEFTVGFIETEEAPRRCSGAEAWSLRLRDRVVELPFSDFVARFGDDPPFHRITHYSRAGAVVWEADGARSRPAHGGGDEAGSWGRHARGGAGGSWRGAGAGCTHHAGTPGPSPLGGRGVGAVGTPPSAVGFVAQPAATTSPPPPPPRRGAQLPPPHDRPHGGVASLLAAAAERAAARDAAPARPQRGAARRGGCVSPGTPGDAAGGDDTAWRGSDQSAAAEPGLSWWGGAGSDGPSTPPGAAPWQRRAAAADPTRPCGGSGDESGAASSCGGEFELAALFEDEGTEDDERWAGERDQEGQPEGQLLRDYSELPDPIWGAVLSALDTRDACAVARASRGLRGLVGSTPGLWQALYARIHGAPPPPALSAPPAARRACRRSELRAARWLDAAAARSAGGAASTRCLAMDASKVVSGDGAAVRVWSHATGRRIATLLPHPGRVTGVAFDDESLLTGCAGGVVRLWSIDDLRRRPASLRHHVGAVSAVALLHGLPISAGEEGEIALWDAAAGAPILSLMAEGPVAALDAASPAGRLLSAGWEVAAWDVGAAERVLSLPPPPQRDGGGGGGGGGGGFTCVSAAGSLVAAGRAGQVALWDVRSGECVGTVEPAARGAGGAAAAFRPAAVRAAPFAKPAGGLGAAAGTGAAAASFEPPRCAGVQLDDWKLATGWGTAIEVYDIRSLSGGSPRPGWREPVLSLDAAAPVTCLAFRDEALVAGREGADCAVWRFVSPREAEAAGAGDAGDGDGDGDDAEEWCGGARRRRDKPAGRSGGRSGGGAAGGGGGKERAVPKRERRYPKRRTR
ncbi:hypothetical protein Rsub_02122 [Raphidocelis subcapitata]|uniref:F-box domain-containing protein n=1 Tax=Raphidocelis subcapitata TaxID=307507 RepID=A0A2V0NWQ4_9CHLO|nr:hypothetical protein Rsub_02122 [Raphidocelis subcapitata]|eukprot:GBF89245.1 hypothetical protein Rsub_02122 [Raphidocelis subcapitata]